MWKVIGTQNEEAWLSDYIADIIQSPSPTLPPHNLKIGSVEAHWHEVEPGLAYVATNPQSGPFGRRYEIEWLLKEQLKPFGYRFAAPRFPTPRPLTRSPGYQSIRDFPGHQFTPDVLDKAQRLVQQGRVRLLRNGPNQIAAQVLGDGTDNDGNPDWHELEIQRDDPNSDSITGSHCDCDWGNFQNTPRTRSWKRFQDRPCAHALAAWWQAKSTPLDEDRAPGDMGVGQMALPGTNAPLGPSGVPSASPFTMAPAPQQQAVPGQMSMLPPSPADVLPPFPGDMQQNLPPVNPASVPGQRPGPTPTNPLQYPGSPGSGTFSHVATMTIPQQQRQWQTLNMSYPSSAQTVHEFPNGWTIQHYPTRADAWRAGYVLRNCWQPNLPDNYDDNWIQQAGSKVVSPTTTGTKMMGLHDEMDIPRAVFYQTGEKPGVGRPWSHAIVDARGARNQIPAPEHLALLNEYAANNGLQIHGSTKLAVDQPFQNTDLVQLRYPEKGTLQGRSEEHGAGGTIDIPAGSVGEVLGTDPTTGLVNILIMNKRFDQNVAMEPFGATVWSWPQDLVARPDMRKPGPAIRRLRSYVRS